MQELIAMNANQLPEELSPKLAEMVEDGRQKEEQADLINKPGEEVAPGLETQLAILEKTREASDDNDW